MCACNKKSKPLQARRTSTAKVGTTANPARTQIARPTSQPRGTSPAPLKG